MTYSEFCEKSSNKQFTHMMDIFGAVMSVAFVDRLQAVDFEKLLAFLQTLDMKEFRDMGHVERTEMFYKWYQKEFPI